MQHLVHTVRRHSLQLCHHEPNTEKRVFRQTKQTFNVPENKMELAGAFHSIVQLEGRERRFLLTFPLTTSSLIDESKGRLSSEAAVKTRLMWTSSSKVTNLPCTTCWNSFERTKSSWRCIGEPGGEFNEADEEAEDDGPEQGNDPDSPDLITVGSQIK